MLQLFTEKNAQFVLTGYLSLNFIAIFHECFLLVVKERERESGLARYEIELQYTDFVFF